MKYSFKNQKLAELRDWLLPMLMNVQVRVGHSIEKGNLGEATLRRAQDAKLGMVAEELVQYKHNPKV